MECFDIFPCSARSEYLVHCLQPLLVAEATLEHFRSRVEGLGYIVVSLGFKA